MTGGDWWARRLVTGIKALSRWGGGARGATEGRGGGRGMEGEWGAGWEVGVVGVRGGGVVDKIEHATLPGEPDGFAKVRVLYR